MKNKIAFLIVAAGASSRLGFHKQLIAVNNVVLLQKLINMAKNISELNTFLVLGAYKEEITEEINTKGITIIVNPDWKEGMGKSIAVGLKVIQGCQYEGVLISVVDQPFLNNKIIKAILNKIDRNKNQIIVSKYDIGSGPPTFFHKSYFLELAELSGDIGAKPIVKKYAEKVEYIAFEKGSLDIDTKEDLLNFKIVENITKNKIGHKKF